MRAENGCLHAATAGDTRDLHEAVEAAMRRGAALISLPQARGRLDLVVHSFARQQGFTGAETSVLEALLAGQRPDDIARAKGVQLSTVRTQIGQLRQKSGAHSMRELLDRVGALPPMLAVVR